MLDSNITLILRGELLMPIRNSPESLNQEILVGIILVGRLGLLCLVTDMHHGTRLIRAPPLEEQQAAGNHLSRGICVSIYLPHTYIRKEREGPRLRVATVRSGAPRSQAAGCLVKLQAAP